MLYVEDRDVAAQLLTRAGTQLLKRALVAKGLALLAHIQTLDVGRRIFHRVFSPLLKVTLFTFLLSILSFQD